LWVALPASASGPAPLELEAAPQEVRIGAFFSGRTVSLSGSSGSTVDVVVEVFGPERGGRFHVKDRVGPLWMNVDEVHLGNAPFMYLLLTSDDAVSDKDLALMGIGLKNVERGIVVRPDDFDRDVIFGQFLKLKRSQGLYAERRGTVRYDSPDGGRRIFHTEFRLPASAAPGNYEIVATGLEGTRSVRQIGLGFRVVEVGVIKSIRDLAFSHGWIYGIVCVVIALLVGGVIGVFFKRAGAR
jgi:uncharacterized protein (TIGR02186 family)